MVEPIRPPVQGSLLDLPPEKMWPIYEITHRNGEDTGFQRRQPDFANVEGRGDIPENFREVARSIETALLPLLSEEDGEQQEFFQAYADAARRAAFLTSWGFDALANYTRAMIYQVFKLRHSADYTSYVQSVDELPESRFSRLQGTIASGMARGGLRRLTKRLFKLPHLALMREYLKGIDDVDVKIEEEGAALVLDAMMEVERTAFAGSSKKSQKLMRKDMRTGTSLMIVHIAEIEAGNWLQRDVSMIASRNRLHQVMVRSEMQPESMSLDDRDQIERSAFSNTLVVFRDALLKHEMPWLFARGDAILGEMTHITAYGHRQLFFGGMPYFMEIPGIREWYTRAWDAVSQIRQQTGHFAKGLQPKAEISFKGVMGMWESALRQPGVVTQMSEVIQQIPETVRCGAASDVMMRKDRQPQSYTKESRVLLSQANYLLSLRGDPRLDPTITQAVSMVLEEIEQAAQKVPDVGRCRLIVPEEIWLELEPELWGIPGLQLLLTGTDKKRQPLDDSGYYSPRDLGMFLGNAMWLWIKQHSGDYPYAALVLHGKLGYPDLGSGQLPVEIQIYPDRLEGVSIARASGLSRQVYKA